MNLNVWVRVAGDTMCVCVSTGPRPTSAARNERCANISNWFWDYKLSHRNRHWAQHKTKWKSKTKKNRKNNTVKWFCVFLNVVCCILGLYQLANRFIITALKPFRLFSFLFLFFFLFSNVAVVILLHPTHSTGNHLTMYSTPRNECWTGVKSVNCFSSWYALLILLQWMHSSSHRTFVWHDYQFL